MGNSQSGNVGHHRAATQDSAVAAADATPLQCMPLLPVVLFFGLDDS
jgi:hypothetical protein